MKNKAVHIGYENFLNLDKYITVINADPAPSKRMIQSARDNGKLIDATAGRKTRSIIITNSDYIIITARNPETVASNINGEKVVAKDED